MGAVCMGQHARRPLLHHASLHAAATATVPRPPARRDAASRDAHGKVMAAEGGARKRGAGCGNEGWGRQFAPVAGDDVVGARGQGPDRKTPRARTRVRANAATSETFALSEQRRAEIGAGGGCAGGPRRSTRVFQCDQMLDEPDSH
eukprot:184564-Chlamydomonas_euryale.AAC.2